jgi:trypsin-like peptidase
MKLAPILLLVVASLLTVATSPSSVFAEAEVIDLRVIAQKARPAVMLLVVSDSSGKEIATGTGFFVSADGKLITNYHVIEDASSIIAKSENGGLFPVEGVLAGDPRNDLALLKLDGKDLPFLTLSRSDNIEAGTRVAVIGSPLGLEGTLSEGIVSAVRDVKDGLSILQITAAISPGSSGSPVLNEKGQVVGIACALLGGGQALNFAVPCKPVEDLIRKGSGVAKPEQITQFVKQSEEIMSLSLRLEPGRNYDARRFLTTTQRELFAQVYPHFDEEKAEKNWEWKDVDPIGLFSPSENRKRRREQFLYEYSPTMLLDADGEVHDNQLPFKKYLNDRFPQSTVLITARTVKLICNYTPQYEDLLTTRSNDTTSTVSRNLLKLTAELGVQWAQQGGTALYIYNGSILMSKYASGHVSMAYPDIDQPPH